MSPQIITGGIKTNMTNGQNVPSRDTRLERSRYAAMGEEYSKAMGKLNYSKHEDYQHPDVNADVLFLPVWLYHARGISHSRKLR